MGDNCEGNNAGEVSEARAPEKVSGGAPVLSRNRESTDRQAVDDQAPDFFRFFFPGAGGSTTLL